MKFKNSRKGSLELSVNAIVILVMAIAILGLGLAFIRGALQKGQAQVFKAIDNAELENPATADKPVTVDRNVQVKVGSTAQVRLGYYNSGSEPVDATPSLTSCYSSTNPTNSIVTQFTLSSGSQSVGAGKAVGFQGLLGTVAATTLVQGAYVCTVEIGGESAQFFVTVTS